MIYVFLLIGVALLVPIFLILNRRYMGILVERRIAAYQNELMARHCDEVENIYKQMRGWRHDYHNHIQTMKAYLSLGQIREIDEYLNNLDNDLTQVDTILKTGNVMVDAILNSKISLAQAKEITVDVAAIVPKTLPVQAVDLCVIIGNLLDNAIESCIKQADTNGRFIRVYLGVHKKMFYISVSNSVDGMAVKTGKLYLTTKISGSHGFGLVRIDKISEKYQGFVNRQHEEGVFATEIMLPL